MSSPHGMSPEAMNALQVGGGEARQLGHRFLGVEHLALGLCQSSSPGLESWTTAAKLDRGTWRSRLRQLAEQEPVKGSMNGLPQTPRLRAVLDLAGRIAEKLARQSVQTEHLMLALLQQGRGLAAQALSQMGHDPLALQRSLAQALEGVAPATPGAGPGPNRSPAQQYLRYLSELGRDLTEQARQGQLNQVVGRRKEMLGVLKGLARRTKGSVLLVGEPGVGKTCIVEGLASLAVGAAAPQGLAGKRIIEISPSALVAGTSLRGDFERRLEGIIKEAEEHPEVILFLDEVHNLVGAGAVGQGAMDAANILKPALGRGRLACIAATTLAEYRQYIEKDPALSRRFELVQVEEPNPEQTLEILRGLKPSFEEHHGVRIEESALVEAVNLAARHLPERRFPDKAIDLIDRTCTELRFQTLSPQGQADGRLLVKADQVARLVAERTGIPVARLEAGDREMLGSLEANLRQRIIGQDPAVATVSQAIIAARQFGRPGRPLAVLMFLGPTGVGKTEMAKALAELMFGGPDNMVRLDMSEYMERHTVSRLVGAPPGYAGHGQEGQLTGAVRQRPYCLLLLDEFEKAHPDVANMFLQVFDQGRLTDGQGRTVDFSNTLIIMTSNLGAQAAGPAGAPPITSFRGMDSLVVESGADQRRRVEQELHKAYKPEFINRIDELVLFSPLTAQSLRRLVDVHLEGLERQLAQRSLKLRLEEGAADLLASLGYRPEYGARELRRVVDRMLYGPLAKFLLEHPARPGQVLLVAARGDSLAFALDEARP